MPSIVARAESELGVAKVLAALRLLRRIAIVLISIVLIVAGIVMLVTPGPGVVTIVGGLAVLGTEFERPRRWVKSLRERFNLNRSPRDDAAASPEGAASE